MVRGQSVERTSSERGTDSVKYRHGGGPSRHAESIPARTQGTQSWWSSHADLTAVPFRQCRPISQSARTAGFAHVGSLLLYHIVTVHILWYAPLYAWLLLVSAWARRAPFLWVVLPPFGIFIFEKVAFHTSYFCDFLRSRVSGGTEAMNNMQGNFPLDPGLHLTPGMFLVTPGLWLGLIFAAAFLYAAARLRRYQGPM